MSHTAAPSRIGLFAVLLSVILISLFGSLLAANRALSVADREAVVLDARGAALVAERELRIDAEALTFLFDPLMPSTAPNRSVVAPTSPAFDAVWVLNKQARIVARSGDAVVDPVLVADLAKSVSPDSWPHVRALRTTQPGALLVAVPLTHRGAILGSAVGMLAGTRLLRALHDTAVDRRWIALRAGNRTIATTGDRDGGRMNLVAAATIRLPGDTLQIDIAHARSAGAVRSALWLLGLIAVFALLIGLARERRQAMSLAERTTELERLYQEVARSNRMKSEFLANVSHELRTPLNAIVGFVEMLRECVYGELSPRQSLPVDRIAASATHLRHLVDRLLDIAKIAAGRLEVHPEPLVLRPFVLNVASEMESLINERGLALSIGVAPSLPRIRTDQTHLRQILINLIGNAVKYTSSGSINVRARAVGNGAVPADQEPGDRDVGPPPDPATLWIALQVSDTGVGIAAADQQRIFDEFEQVNAGARTDSARRGTGLGLAISKRLARLIGGDITVASEPGKGSVFTVWLPVDTTDGSAS